MVPDKSSGQLNQSCFSAEHEVSSYGIVNVNAKKESHYTKSSFFLLENHLEWLKMLIMCHLIQLSIFTVVHACMHTDFVKQASFQHTVVLLYTVCSTKQRIFNFPDLTDWSHCPPLRQVGTNTKVKVQSGWLPSSGDTNWRSI